MSEFELFYTIIGDEVYKRERSKILCDRTKILNIVLKDGDQFVIPKKLKYFKKPSSFPLDLNLGFEDYKFREKCYFNYNLRIAENYLLKYNGRSLLRSTNKQAICTSKNTLRKVMETPYSVHDPIYSDWTIRAAKIKDVIYLVNLKRDEDRASKEDTYHYKFQQYCFSDSPFKAPVTDEPIDENYQMSCFFRKSMGNFDIFYSGEIAGIQSKYKIQNIASEKTLQKCQFVVTKLLKKPPNPNFDWKKHPKILQWWLQSYMGAEENIYFGFKTKTGFVNSEIQYVNYRELPQYQKWKPEVCKRFLCDFLTRVQEKMSTINNPYTVFEFKYEAKLKLIKYRVLEGKSEDVFLSEKFIQYMRMT